MVTAFAPGKCILFGEHAVVYGQPAVAVSIDAGVEVTISESNKWSLEGMPFEPSKHPHISHIIHDIFQYSGSPLEIDVKSGLFSAAGLGSSAALSNSVGAALHHLTKPEEPLDLISLARIGHSAEANARKGGLARLILPRVHWADAWLFRGKEWRVLNISLTVLWRRQRGAGHGQYVELHYQNWRISGLFWDLPALVHQLGKWWQGCLNLLRGSHKEWMT